MTATRCATAARLVWSLVIQCAGHLWPLWAMLGILGGIFWFCMSAVDYAPASATTRDTMSDVGGRVTSFCREHRRLPSSLDELPRVSEKGGVIVDAWGRPIEFGTIDESNYTLTSLGSDGMPGGADEGKDIIETITVPFLCDEKDVL